MKVNAQTFFNFCAHHVPLLRAISERGKGEFSESEILHLIRDRLAEHEELPETTWRRLCELQILVPTEPGGSLFLLADPVERLLAYLFDEANPTTPEVIRGYIASLEALSHKLTRAIESDDVISVDLAFNEINRSLRRIHADLDETQRAVQIEVATFKVNRENISVRDRYRRIVFWMERYVEPMIQIVTPDGAMAAAFQEVHRLLQWARDQSLFNDHPALERNLRYLRRVRQHALNVFQDCRKELQPLYESLRRSSFIAEGAARALEKLQREGIANWGASPVVGFWQLRRQDVPGEGAITNALRRVIEHPPEVAPVIALGAPTEAPPELVRRLWLDQLPAQAVAALPIEDLLEWLAKTNPHKATSEIAAGFGLLVFHEQLRARFSDAPARDYQTEDGELRGHPLRLENR